MNICDFTPEIINLIIACDHEVYRGMLSIPSFARAQTPNTIMDWAICCGVNVKLVHHSNLTMQAITQGKLHGYALVWTLNGKIHRGGDKPAIEIVNVESTCNYWFKYGLPYRINDKHTQELTITCPGFITTVVCWLNRLCKPHRINEHALSLTQYTTEGILYSSIREWYIDGIVHRYDGPAAKAYNYKDNISKHLHVIHGNSIEYDDYIDALGHKGYI